MSSRDKTNGTSLKKVKNGKVSSVFQWGLIVVGLTMILGVIVTIYSINKIDQGIRVGWLNLLDVSAAAVNPSRIRDWIPGKPNLSDPNYIRVREQLVLISNTVKHEKVHPLYILLKKDNQIFVQIDAAEEASPEYAAPGELYENPPSEIHELFNKGGRYSVGPYADKYGKFVSSFVSINDPLTGQVLAVIGADVDTASWRNQIIVWYFIIGSGFVLFLIIEAILITYIYKRKKYELNLEVSENHFRSIVDISVNLIYRTDSQGNFTFLSKSVFEMCGFTAEELLGKNVSDFVNKTEQPLLLENFQKVLQGETVVNFEGHLYKKDGTKFFVEFSALPVMRDGVVVEVQGILHDITARRLNEDLLRQHSENIEKTQKAVLNILEDVAEEKDKNLALAKDLEKFKLAVDNTSDHIVITDPEGIVLYANKAAEKITGYKIDQAKGKKAASLWKMPMPKEYYIKMWDTIKKKKRPFVGVIQNKRKNGEIYDASISISPIINEKGDIVFFVGLERDITKEKEIDRAKTEFVSLASHQLRTPLSTINWYAEMLIAGDAGKLSEEQSNFVNEIYHGNQRMVELVNSLLNVSRLELGTFLVEPTNENILEIAEIVVKELTPLINNKKINLIKKYDETIGFMPLDRKLTDIVILNLLSNAVKYTPEEGGVTLSIEKKKDGIWIIVQDNGYGIPVAQQEKIFTKLFRADNAREKDADGTGLGLYIVKSILKNVGGDVSFKSEENKGTTFFAKIPLSGMKAKAGTKSLN
ncbi:MAG TPA: PAS domain-containing sensor histidine kinase [Candidatus Magasanikbacteria bacterium]|nr:PAS domain-containing sensor histidine kinase [Candidatus Magasanikbacteria bacterium]